MAHCACLGEVFLAMVISDDNREEHVRILIIKPKRKVFGRTYVPGAHSTPRMTPQLRGDNDIHCGA